MIKSNVDVVAGATFEYKMFPLAWGVMTRRILWNKLASVVSLLCVYAATAVAAKFSGQDWLVRAYEPMRDFVPIVIGLAGTYVADTLQRRGQFVAALRDLWYEMVRAKGEMVAFLRSKERAADEFRQVWTAQSNVIDMVRGVYRNVGETNRLVGFRPFEPLVTMLSCLERADPQGNKTVDSATIVAEIEESWNALREVFLDEFVLPEPEHSVLSQNARRLKSPGATLTAQLTKSSQTRRYGRAAK